MATISVCVPVYNSSTYLRECIESIRNQTFKDLEIICVDDGSTDDSLEILKEFQRKDPRVQLIVQERNMGVGAARNQAIDLASGQYMSFIDSDDFIEPEMFEELYNKAIKNDAEIAICDVNLYSDGGRLNKRKWFTPIEGKAAPETLYKNTQPTNKIASLDLIRRESFYFLEGNSDGVYVDLMVAAKNITSVHKPFYNYRIRANSLSSEFRVKNILESVASCKLLLSNCKAYKEYYEFKLIEALLQLQMVSIKEENYKTYQDARKDLLDLDYKKNTYLYSLLKKEHSTPVFWAMINILPWNYHVSSILIKMLR
ncbi:glycosyltransferase family 2 protein [Streptococcus suis]|uniref:glycosyltransferase family 2 protein n=1 Tax=Streptococcus suis TaxID=1307 RepID=UPI000CF50FF7|nr:glycosyltransferase family 2 protein [Streptococcus suis]